MSAVLKRIQPEEYFKQHVEKGIRLDGRDGGLESLRPISISKGSISSADGSSVVKKGNTTVVCGIKLELGTPSLKRPNHGYLVPNVDLPPICHAQFRPGPPSDEAQSLSTFVMDVLTNSGMIDTESLCITPGKLCWVLYIDLMCLNHDGNISDAALTAMVAAVRDLRIPKVTIESAKDNQDVDEEETVNVHPDDCSSLSLVCQPVGITMALAGEKVLIDPTAEEENFASGSVTIVLNEKQELCHFYKSGEGESLSSEMLSKCTKLAKKQARALQKLLDKN